MTKKLLTIAAIAILSTNCIAQKTTGIYIADSKTKIPIADAIIKSKNADFTGITDENGFVNTSTLKDSTHKLIISCVGYSTKEVAANNEIVYLDSKIASLSEITVKASARSGIFKTISDFDIHLRPINNSQEVLRIVPGLFIGQHSGGGKAEQIFLRGFDLDHGTDINISVDGMPVNMVSHAHGQGYADLHFVIPELIDKVNFNKGPYFADKGNLTTAGFVEFKTKTFLEKDFVKVEAGQYGTIRNIVGINLIKPNRIKRNQSLYIAGESSYTKGYFESSQNFSRYNGMIKYFGQLTKNTNISASITAFASKWNASGQIPDRAVKDGTVGFYGAIDNTEGGNTSRYNAIVNVATQLNKNSNLKQTIFYTKNDFKLYSNFTFYKIDTINGDQIRQAENRNMMGYSAVVENKHLLGTKNATINIGLQARYDIIDNLELSRTKDRILTTEQIMLGKVNELNTSIFASEKIGLTNKFDVSVGLRADNFNNKYFNELTQENLSAQSFLVSPKLNFNYKVNDKVQLYWYNGRGFHSNDTRVAVAQNGKKVVPPGWGSDVGGVFKIGKKLILQSAVWFLQLDQEFVYVGDEGVVQASGKSKRIGVDASIRYELAKNVYADFDVSVANPRATDFAKVESYLPLAPRFTSVGGLTYRKEKGLNGSLRYRFMGDRPANENYSVTAKGYFIVDAAINYTKKKWEAGLSVQNVLNTKWKETQFDTESRLQHELQPVSEIHFTPGTPFFARASFTLYF